MDAAELATALRAQLATALREHLGPVAVEGLARLTGGASRETWAFDAVSAGGSRTELILRRDPPGRPSEPGAMSREARAIASARAAGLAVPEVLARTVLAGQLGAFAAGLHAIEPPGDFPHPDPVADLRSTLAGLGGYSPVFELALSALEADPPPARGPVTVHGDLRLGNLIIGHDSLRAVIDWELVHAGNPAEDLGWLCVKAWRFGAAAPAAGVGTREELVAAYRAAGGADISLDELRWWEILGTLRWGVICMSQAWAHLSGAHRSVELAAIGRRICEQEWDLLLLLAPDDAAAAAARRPRPDGAPRPAPAPHGRPTASELLDAVRQFLTEQVMPATAGHLAFHARVAANVLGIVARELELGPLPPQAGLADNVAARLAVANPRYFEATPPAS